MSVYIRFRPLRFKNYLEWFGHCFEGQSGWIASDSGLYRSKQYSGPSGHCVIYKWINIIRFRSLRFKNYLEWFGHFLEFQSDWTASDSGSDSDLWAFTNYLEWFRHNSTISIGLKCVSRVFSLFRVGKMCFYNSESEKHNSLSWVSCIFLLFRVGKMEFVTAQIG